jgi:uncharacterized repeat protein (TIGR01451 family)
MRRFLQGAGMPGPATALKGALLGAVTAGFAAPAFAAGTLAGTNITTVATATYDIPGSGAASVTSNSVTLRVDELLDVSVARTSPGDVITFPGATGQLLSFTISNAGNGSERLALAARDAIGGDQFDPSVNAIVLDSNGNGAYDAGVDTLYVAGSNDPQLAPDSSLAVFVLSSMPVASLNGQRGQIDLTAVAVTGSGAPGTSFAGQGQGGVNAVVGATGADGVASGFYAVANIALSFVKSATVADPFGGATSVPGGTITYTVTATVNGSGSLLNVRVADPIPAGSTYVPGSITLEGAALSDANDGDAGAFTGTGISVALGTLATGATRAITFKVQID